MGVENLINSKLEFQGKLLALRSDSVKFLSNTGKEVEVTREVVQHSAVVVMVAVDDKSNVLLVKQYRYAAGSELLEAPAGGIEPGEKPEEAALRELKEETGYGARKISPLGEFWALPGWCTEYLYGFLLQDLFPCHSDGDEDEDIQVVSIPWDQIPGLIKTGEIKDAKSIVSLLSALYLY